VTILRRSLTCEKDDDSRGMNDWSDVLTALRVAEKILVEFGERGVSEKADQHNRG
jgi:hypothetical protein